MTTTGRFIFWFALVVSVFFQGLLLVSKPIEDQSIWTKAAMSVQTQSPSTFPKLDAYMHPGGPDIEGTVLAKMFGATSYETALNVFLILLNSITIAVLCLLCYILRKNILWPLTVLGLLSLQSLYSQSSLYIDLTPPSLTVSLALPMLCLFSLYLYEHREYESDRTKKILLLGSWSVLAGFIAATRVDVGGVMVAASLIFFLTRFSWKAVLGMGIVSLLAFCVFDPFMWFAPVTQVAGLLSSVNTHYAGATNFSTLYYEYYIANLQRVVVLPLLSIFFGIVFVLCRKEIRSPVPSAFLVLLLLATGILSAIFLSAASQAARYLMPLVFVWDVFLPLFIFSLLSQVQFSFVHTAKEQERARFIFKLFFIFILLAPLAFNYVSEIVTQHTFSKILHDGSAS